MTLPSALTRYREDIEADLKALLMDQSFPLYRMMAYHMGWIERDGEPAEHAGEVGGERIRPSLCLLSCEALGRDASAALSAASAVELVHNFSLIHDDIQAGTPDRHDRPSVWWVWGPAQAINAGDGMHALARLALLRQSEIGIGPERTLEAAGVLDRACLRLCEGQYLDLTYQERVDITSEAYFQMVEGKSGALMGCAAELGAITATDDEQDIKAMARFGFKLGLAFQVRDDILDLWGRENTGNPQAGDILNKKKSLPVIYALQNATGAQKHTLGDVYFKRVMEPEDVHRVVEVLDILGARDFSQDKANTLCQEAIQALDEAHLNAQGKDQLVELARFLVTRDS